MGPQSSQLVSEEAPQPQRAVRLLLDARKLGDGGIGVYIENLIHGLLEIGGVEIALLAKPGANLQFEMPEQVSWLFDRSPCYSLDELFLLGRRLELSSYDLFHTPHYMLPFGISIPSVVTVHDLIHIERPERFYYPWIARRLISSAVKRAHAVITVSNHTRQAVLASTAVSERKVSHIPNAIAPFMLDAPTALALPASMLGSGAFFLAIFSNIKPHKGLRDLLLAYRGFREQHLWRRITATCPNLVLAGFGAEQIATNPALSALIEEVGGITVLGAVSSKELSALYRKASALVVPSLLEGFCLPALEAQASGALVVCRPVGALQELVTERDIVAEDLSIEALQRALKLGLQRSLTTEITFDTKHLERYSRRAVARKVLDLYQTVLSAGGAR